MDRTASDDLRPRGDRADDGHVTFGKHDRLAGAHGLVDDERLHDGADLARCRRLLLRQFGNHGDRLDLDIGSRLSALQRWGHARLDHRGTNALDAHDADIALPERRQQVLQTRLVERQFRNIEDHRPRQEEARRTRREIIEPFQPLSDRSFGGQDDCEEGAAFDADGTLVC